MSMQRVTKRNPCPICGKDSWCLVGLNDAMCMRVPNDHKITFKDGQEAYLHEISARPKGGARLDRRKEEEVRLDFRKMMEEWKQETKPFHKSAIYQLACNLGVSEFAIQCLDPVWCRKCRAWAFPMRDGRGGVVGIRLRNLAGEKWAIKGSHQGLFISNTPQSALLVVCEGPTDTAAAVTLGYFAIGRPSCGSGIDHIKTFVKEQKVKRALIVSDLDDPGLRGAATLAEHLPIPSAIMIPPSKDLRSFLKAGGCREDMDALANQLVWRQP